MVWVAGSPSSTVDRTYVLYFCYGIVSAAEVKALYPRVMSSQRCDEQAALVALLRARPDGLSWPDIMGEVLESGSALDVWERHIVPALLAHPHEPDPMDQALIDLETWTGEGITTLTILDQDYPDRLRGVHQAPPILFARGQLEPGDRAVSVVGSRKASDRGLSIADGVARALVRDGITVLAGLAEGIDTAAHRAAIDAGGRTVAVIGTGIRRYFPRQNEKLQDSIPAHGLVLSQFWPDAPPTRYSFPMRNATMSGYGFATVVVEAGEHSGARIQARLAVEHGRPVILTDLVVRKNKWATELMGRPGVHRADALGEVVDIIRDIDGKRHAAVDTLRNALAL